jgi:hypothetical protein
MRHEGVISDPVAPGVEGVGACIVYADARPLKEERGGVSII